MAVPTVYRSTDAGAPVMLRNTQGTYLNVVRKCLVDGYGAFSPAGWTEEFTSGNTAAFKNGAGGTGCYVKVDDTTAATNGPRVYLTAFSSMSDISTGLNSTGTRNTFRGFTSESNEVAWIVVADEWSAWIGVDTGDGNSSVVYIGDIASLMPADAWRYCVAGANNNMGTAPFWLRGNVATVLLPKNYSGIGAATGYKSLITWGNDVGGTGHTRPSPLDGGEAVAPFLLVNGSELRGRLRGCYVPLANTSAVAFGTVQTGLVAGSECVLLRESTGSVWIETALPWS